MSVHIELDFLFAVTADPDRLDDHMECGSGRSFTYSLTNGILLLFVSYLIPMSAMIVNYSRICYFIIMVNINNATLLSTMGGIKAIMSYPWHIFKRTLMIRVSNITSMSGRILTIVHC